MFKESTHACWLAEAEKGSVQPDWFRNRVLSQKIAGLLERPKKVITEPGAKFGIEITSKLKLVGGLVQSPVLLAQPSDSIIPSTSVWDPASKLNPEVP
jgi:hypothetical protein